MNHIEKARVLRAQFVKLRDLATDEIALQVPNLYPEWKENVNYVANERVFYNEVLYKVLQNHTSQETWAPDVAYSLFAKVLIPDADVIPEWEQPDSTNPYMKGDKVKYDNKYWISTIDYNVWKPGEYGWDEFI